MCKRPELTNFEKTVARKIQARRQDLEYSVPEMIKRLKEAGLQVAVPTYYQWEKADRPISLANLDTIAKVLGTTAETLVSKTAVKRRKK